MSETVDEILQELRGISFSAEDPAPLPPEDDPPADGHTPSVTETLELVREMLGESPLPRPEPSEPRWEDPLAWAEEEEAGAEPEPADFPPEAEEPELLPPSFEQETRDRPIAARSATVISFFIIVQPPMFFHILCCLSIIFIIRAFDPKVKVIPTKQKGFCVWPGGDVKRRPPPPPAG